MPTVTPYGLLSRSKMLVANSAAGAHLITCTTHNGGRVEPVGRPFAGTVLFESGRTPLDKPERAKGCRRERAHRHHHPEPESTASWIPVIGLRLRSRRNRYAPSRRRGVLPDREGPEGHRPGDKRQYTVVSEDRSDSMHPDSRLSGDRTTYPMTNRGDLINQNHDSGMCRMTSSQGQRVGCPKTFQAMPSLA